MFDTLPRRIKILGGALFLGGGILLIGFAIGGIFGLLQENTSSQVIDKNSDLGENAQRSYLTNEGEVAVPSHAQVATFAGGCFWCIEAGFQEEEGVLEAISGFAGGTIPDPVYDDVARGRTDRREAVQVIYDSDIVTYDRLLDIYRDSIDAVDAGGQFNDRGFQYTTALYRHDEAQYDLIITSLDAEQQQYDQPIATEIEPYTTFVTAGPEHQDFYLNSTSRYKRYEKGSGRIKFQESNKKQNSEIEGENTVTIDEVSQGSILLAYEESFVRKGSHEFIFPPQEILKEKLSFIQYRVTQRDGTEPPFANAYRDNTQPGIYVDIVSGEPLYSSADQYKSGTGRPSFTQPIGGDTRLVTLHEDTSLFTTRTEVRSALSDSHLGHVFDDGPADRGGLRYCMNSAAMEFVPLDEMQERGYGEWIEYVEFL